MNENQTSTQAGSLPASHQQIFLIGRPPIGEFLGLVTTQTVGGELVDVTALMDEWRTANDHVRELEVIEADIADGAEVCPPPAHLVEAIDSLQADPVFQRTYRIVPSSIGMVELDRLVVHQKHIDLAHVERIEAALGGVPTDEEVLRLCLPLGGQVPSVGGRRVGQTSFVFTSPSNDLRVLEPVLLSADQLVGYTPPGRAAGVVAVVVGFSSNCFSVLRVNGRLVLHNGSHRAYALRNLGVARAPAVVQDITRPEELDLFGVSALSRNGHDYLSAARPPMLKDYFDPQLRKLVEVPRRYQQITVEYGSGASWMDVPAA